MDKAIIIGIYEYVGFHLCLKFLEQGIEVIGVNTDMDESDLFIEEKRLSIGRNSNFAEKDLASLKHENDLENTNIFIDYYSSYVRGQEAKLISMLQNQLSGTNMMSLCLLLPLQTCGEGSDNQLTFLQSNDRKSKSSYFYLPSIYGPWQPLECALQRSLYEPNQEIIISEREWREDAVYIEDAIAVIWRNLEKEGKNKYVVRSTIKNHWQKLIGLDKVEKPEISSLFEADKDFFILHAGQTEPSEGIRKQKEHLFRILGKKYNDY